MISYAYLENLDSFLQDAFRGLYLSKRSRVLNVACEYHLIPPVLSSILSLEQMTGLEINREIVAANPRVKYADIDRDRFPFADAAFDLVMSLWGMEHFQTEHVFYESARLLKSGGRFVFLTPNVLYPPFFINCLAGSGLGSWYYRRVMGSRYHPHRAWYRFNRLRTIKRAAQRSGLKLERLAYVGPGPALGYVRFHPWAESFMKSIERLMTRPILYRLKPYLWCVLVKR